MKSLCLKVLTGILPFLLLSCMAKCQQGSFGEKGFHAPVFKRPINDERFITINGIKQWVSITGDDSSHPVILFLHGGPGSPLSPYADAIYGKWKKDFILVQWDQRGAGRTYGYDAPDELSPAFLRAHPLSIEQMVADGIELCEYIINRFGKKKVILFGTSWGSILGVKMAIKRPDLFYAYVGHSQVVNPSANLIYDYQKVYKMAKQANDHASAHILDSIGVPPYENPVNAGKLFRIIKKYEKKKATPAPAAWFTLSPEYDNEKDSMHRADGDDYSFVNYVGYKRLGVQPMDTINLLNDGLNFNIPAFFIQGEEDVLTPSEITKEYFDKVHAPKKKFILLPKAAHGFNQAVVDMQYTIMKKSVMPLIKD